MPGGGTVEAVRRAAQIIAEDHARLLQFWGGRGFWQIKLRWAAPPLMAAGLLGGRALGFDLAVGPILAIAGIILAYNLVVLGISRRPRVAVEERPRLALILTGVGMMADFAALLALFHFTGGVSSPLVVFLIFHVTIAAIQFPLRFANAIAAVAAAGLWLSLLGEVSGRLTPVAITFRGQPVHAIDRPVYLTVLLILFTATLFLTVLLVSRVMVRLRKRVGDLARVTTDLGLAHDKLRSLYAMVCAIGGERRLEPILDTVVSELARVMGVPAAAVNLVSDDGRTLRLVAAHGLPEGLARDTVFRIHGDPVPLVGFEGESLLHGSVEGGKSFNRALADLGIEATLRTSLKIEDRVIGTLVLYSRSAERLDGETEFFELAAQLVAIAIEDARANEAVERLIEERTQFMLQAAHNLRAPLAAGMSLLALVRDGTLGPLTEKQLDSLQRVDGRLEALHQMVGDILTIAKARDRSREIPDVVVDLGELARSTEETFRAAARKKGIRLEIEVDDDVPPVDSGADLLERIMENLVSNAIKYTPEGGTVVARFARSGADEIRITVRDTGIGIPRGEQEKLFTEFFRASNAKRHTSAGTGLGLTLVKRTVERHRGRIRLESEEGQGTTVEIHLPIRQTKGVDPVETASPEG